MKSDYSVRLLEDTSYFEDNDVCEVCAKELVMKNGKLVCLQCDKKRERTRKKVDAWQ